jgi:hypothetical protein
MDETTITFSIIMIVTIPVCAWAGYRVGYFRGWVAALGAGDRLSVLPARISAKKRFYALVASLEQKRVKIPFYGYFGEK